MCEPERIHEPFTRATELPTDPLDWTIEVCSVCGCQLGPGMGSRTSGDPDDHTHARVVLRVIARPPHEQEQRHPKLVEVIPQNFLSDYYNTDPVR